MGQTMMTKLAIRRTMAAMTLTAALLTAGCTQPASLGSGTEGEGGAGAGSAAGNGQRIISTTVAVTQITDALELDLIGIPKSVKELPKRYAGVTEIGNPMSPDMEIVKSLQPTEVLSVSTLQYDLAPNFDNAGVKASFLNLTSVEEMNAAITALGQKYGRQKQAESVVGKVESQIAQIKEKIKGKQAPKVLILLGVPGSYLVATEKSYIGNLVKHAGGVNVITDAKVEYLASNTEYLQQAKPDVILRAAHGMPEEVVVMFDKEFKTNTIWKHFDAVANNRVYDLEERLFGTTGSLDAAEALGVLVKMLYPELK